jgi:hypothetical protein
MPHCVSGPQLGSNLHTCIQNDKILMSQKQQIGPWNKANQLSYKRQSWSKNDLISNISNPLISNMKNMAT